MIDSGATVNLIDEEAWSKIQKRNNKSIMLQKSTSHIYPYGSDKPLELKGKFTTTLESKTWFTPAAGKRKGKGNAGNLLSCHTTCGLGLIRIHVNHIDNETTATQQVQPHNTLSPRPAQQISLDYTFE